MNTPEIVTILEPNQIFVYGTNQFAQHRSGSAKAALAWGATMGETPMGLKGQTYGIITTSFTVVPVSIEFIKSQVYSLYHFADLRQDLTFIVTKIGTGIAGFETEEIAAIFKALPSRKNIVLPKEFEIQTQRA